MSQYISQIISNVINYSPKISLTIAKADQAPMFSQTEKDIKETKMITIPNYDSGISFSLSETFRQAVKNNNSIVANNVAISILERLAIFGTSDTRIDINASKLTNESALIFYEIALYNIDLTLKTLGEIYNDARAPKNSHMVYLIALLTSVTESEQIDSKQVVSLRTKGYSFVPSWRIPTHFIEWVNTHLSLNSLNALKSKNLTSSDVVTKIIDDNCQMLPEVNQNKNREKNKKKIKTKSSKVISRSGGTGNGFRNACKAWYLKYCTNINESMDMSTNKENNSNNANKANKLAMHICKKPTHNGTSHKDILSLIHLETTSKKKCMCKTKIKCECKKLKPYECANLIPVACQISLAYAVSGLDHAIKILVEGIDRIIYKGGDPSIDPDIREAFNVMAFLCGVTKAKIDYVNHDIVVNLIQNFQLTHEMISNKHINHPAVLMALSTQIERKFQDGRDNQDYQYNQLCRELLFDKLILRDKPNNSLPEFSPDLSSELMNTKILSLIESFYPSGPLRLPKESDTNQTDNDQIKNDNDIDTEIENDNKIVINMPITALIRNLNRLTINGVFDPTINPLAEKMIDSVSKHITNQDVLKSGMIHPINIFSAWSTYSKGHGFKGSQTWIPVPSISAALLDATEIAFNNATDYNASCAFFMDASSSMSCSGSAPGFPNLLALDVAVILMLSFYRSTKNDHFQSTHSDQSDQSTHSDQSDQSTQSIIPSNHIVGYFGGSFSGSRPSNSMNRVKKVISIEDIQNRSKDFVDISKTVKSEPDLSFNTMKKLLGNGMHMGMTNIGSALWHLIGKLKLSIDKIDQKTLMNDDFLTVFDLEGFVEMILYVTDNDVNSGDQPTDVLALYRGLVYQAFQLLPRDKNRQKTCPDKLFQKYITKMVVVATMGGDCTIGDPRDQNILNISGFDSSCPAMINTFLKKSHN
jgi:hypothetical protein